ncbi:MAG: DUF424 family protein [archaeon]
MYIVKKHKADPTNTLLAIVDEELFGKKIEEENKILDLTSSFYKGEIKSEEEVLKMIKQVKHLNVVGEKIVSLLKKEGLVDNVSEIDGVPYAQSTILRG